MESERYCTIIIPSNTSYLDICTDFLRVFKTAWPECNYKIVLSLFGRPVPFDSSNDMIEVIYNGANKYITKCVYEAAVKNPSLLYLVFLPDAFMCKKVNDSEIQCLIETINSNQIEYCMLRPRKHYSKVKKVSDGIRYIATNDRYSHSFIAFAATRGFIEQEFNIDDYNDIDFELKYLNKRGQDNEYYNNHAIVTKNYFHIIPAIEKGKWDRGVLRILRRRYPNIEFSKREKLDIKTQMALTSRRVLMKFIPDRLRVTIKRIYIKIMGKGPLVTND